MYGSHLSIAGGLYKALLAAERLQCETVQIFTANPRTFGYKKIHCFEGKLFTKNQQQWRVPPLREEVVAEWVAHRRRLKFRKTVSHDSYLINLASPDPELWRRSVELFIEELRRCAVLGIPYLVTHPGAHAGAGEEEGLKRVAAALDVVHREIPPAEAGGPGGVITCLEITAGQGSSLGYRLEHLEEIMMRVKNPERLGVCLDTAHLFAAGYDFRGRKYDQFRKELSMTVGLRRVKVLHLNDSKKDLGSRVDRHDHIGHGKIGREGFKGFVRDPVFANVPKILETPKLKHPSGRDWDEVNLETLRGLMK
jgi:deoxyribonuclease IV